MSDIDQSTIYSQANPFNQPIPTEGPATEPTGPKTYSYLHPQANLVFAGTPPPMLPPEAMNGLVPPVPKFFARSPSDMLYDHARKIESPGPEADTSQGGAGANHYPSASGVPRLPPILQVEKQQVTTSATQLASASRRRNEANFVCPVPNCGSTFTRRFNLRGHLRSHTEERPYLCGMGDCKKGFARQHDCKRHQALHKSKSEANVCRGCKKTFSRLDALNRHLRSDGGQECRARHEQAKEVKHEEEEAVS